MCHVLFPGVPVTMSRAELQELSYLGISHPGIVPQNKGSGKYLLSLIRLLASLLSLLKPSDYSEKDLLILLEMLQHVLDADPSNEMVKHVSVSVLRSIHNDSIRRIARNHDEPNLLHLGRILVG